MFTRIYLCREDSAAVQRSVEVECPTRQVTQEDTLLVCIIVSARIYTSLPCLQARLGRRATAASPPCPPGRFHWPCATLSPSNLPVKVHTLKRQCPALSMPLLPAADHLVPITYTEYHDRPRPTSLPAPLTPHTLPDPPRAVPAGPGRPRAWSPPSAPPPLPRACWRTPPTGPCSRTVRVRAQVRHIVHACEGGGQEDGNSAKGKRGCDPRECIQHSSVPGIQ